VRYAGSIKRVSAAAAGLVAVVRRRRESRRPRVRLRLAHGEARLLPEGTPAHERLLSLASELVAEYGRPGRGRS
jgi:hypothetical protein